MTAFRCYSDDIGVFVIIDKPLFMKLLDNIFLKSVGLEYSVAAIKSLIEACPPILEYSIRRACWENDSLSHKTRSMLSGFFHTTKTSRLSMELAMFFAISEEVASITLINSDNIHLHNRKTIRASDSLEAITPFVVCPASLWLRIE